MGVLSQYLGGGPLRNFLVPKQENLWAVSQSVFHCRRPNLIILHALCGKAKKLGLSRALNSQPLVLYLYASLVVCCFSWFGYVVTVQKDP